MAVLTQEIALFEQMRRELEAKEPGKWVLIRGADFIGTYPDFEVAAADAVRRFGNGPYLIREIGAPDMVIPASVVYASFEDA